MKHCLLRFIYVFLIICLVLFLTGKLCEDLECQYYSRCEMTSDASVECKCPEKCEREFAPVCGTNEKTYRNMCVLKLESCLAGEWIRKSKHGNCGE